MHNLVPVDLSVEKRTLFVVEAENVIDRAKQTLLGMEEAGVAFSRRSDDPANLESRFREMHTLKGNAEPVGLGGYACGRRPADAARLRQDEYKAGFLSLEK